MDRRTLLKTAVLTLSALGVHAEENPPPAGDPAPLANEFEKYPRCVVCGMDRRRFHYSRHLTHYADGRVDPTCSIHCTAETAMRERRRGFLAIYAPDYGVPGEPKPLIEVSSATYLIGSSLKGVMTPVSKYAFSDPAAAKEAQQAYGGEIAAFPAALAASLNEFAGGIARRYANDLDRQRRKAADRDS